MLSVKIERYIEERLTAKISLGELCAEFFLSKNALYRLFAEEFNSTVNDFITKKRLTLAEELLAHSPELNVTEISAKAGFPAAWKKMEFIFMTQLMVISERKMRSVFAPNSQ